MGDPRTMGARAPGPAVSGALLVAGTSCGAGKSVVVAGLCRWLHRQGVSVAPFQAQSSSVTACVTADGAEVGRGQVIQAAACGLQPDARMNPVVLRPGVTHTEVFVLGQSVGEVDAAGYAENADRLLDVAVDSLGQLRREFDVVICESAAAPAEISQRGPDLADLSLARAAGLAALLVADASSGGAFAGIYGTIALLDPADQALISALVLNKARGALGHPDSSGLLRCVTGRPMLGALSWAAGLWPDMAAGGEARSDAQPQPPVAGTPLGQDVLRVSVVRLPRIGSFADIDALAAEPGVLVRMAATPEELADADLVVLPGSRATVADLAFLRERGISEAIAARTQAGRPVLGIGGGFQMLADEICDDVESGAGTVSGLGLLPASVTFRASRILGRRTGTAYGVSVSGGEACYGSVIVSGIRAEPFLDGCRSGSVWGTSWHGTLENDQFRRAFLTDVAAFAGRDFKPSPDTNLAALREAGLDRLGDLVAENLDTDTVLRLIEGGPPPGLPILGPSS